MMQGAASDMRQQWLVVRFFRPSLERVLVDTQKRFQRTVEEARLLPLSLDLLHLLPLGQGFRCRDGC